jgi:integrase
VFPDGASGLRVGELLGLKWEDVDFERDVIHIKRSIVKQRMGPPKTEASQKPIPLNTELAKALLLWKMNTNYNRLDDGPVANSAAGMRDCNAGPKTHCSRHSPASFS